MSNLIPFPDPLIKDYERAYRARFNVEPPRITKRTRDGYIIHGVAGDSPLRSSRSMRRIIDWMISLTELEQRA